MKIVNSGFVNAMPIVISKKFSTAYLIWPLQIFAVIFITQSIEHYHIKTVVNNLAEDVNWLKNFFSYVQIWNYEYAINLKFCSGTTLTLFKESIRQCFS